jgi:hypothetical protein
MLRRVLLSVVVMGPHLSLSLELERLELRVLVMEVL